LKDVEGSSTGVFVGIMNDDFKQAVHERVNINGYTSTGNVLNFKKTKEQKIKKTHIFVFIWVTNVYR
jgi:hypothetical protein